MFCSKCGNQIAEGTAFCPSCGQSVNGQQSTAGNVNTNTANQQAYNQNTAYTPNQNGVSYQNTYANPKSLIDQLSSKIKIEGYVWIGVAVAQYIIGIFYIGNVINMISWYYDVEEYIVPLITGVILFIIATINIRTSMEDLKYAKNILTSPVGIVAKYEPVAPRIVNLIYNILFGGVVGVIGSAFGFVTRGFVMSNEKAFLAIEAQHSQQQH